MEIDILDKQEKVLVTPALRRLLIRIFRSFWQMEVRSGQPEVSVVLCDNDFIQSLNRRYRQLDQPTDVLSFPQAELSPESGGRPLPGGEPVLLGDVVISLERAMEQAHAYGHSFQREVGYLLTHGLLHLVGMEHETADQRRAMRQKEEAILARVDLAANEGAEG